MIHGVLPLFRDVSSTNWPAVIVRDTTRSAAIHHRNSKELLLLLFRKGERQTALALTTNFSYSRRGRLAAELCGRSPHFRTMNSQELIGIADFDIFPNRHSSFRFDVPWFVVREPDRYSLSFVGHIGRPAKRPRAATRRSETSRPRAHLYYNGLLRATDVCRLSHLYHVADQRTNSQDAK